MRPTFQTIRLSFVVAVIGGNFQAIAQRGSRPTTPSSRHSARSSTLITTPSISKSSASRRSSHHAAALDDLVGGLVDGDLARSP